MTWHTQGTVNVTKNSSTVTGSGTNWVENIRVGDGFNGPDGRMYQITNVASNTSITIAPAYAGSSASGQSYGVVPVQGYLKESADRLASVVNEFEDMPSDIAILQSSVTSINQSLDNKANNSTQIIAGTGLSGGGNLSANRTLSVNYGTSAGTAAQGNDSRIVNAASKSELNDGLDTKADKTTQVIAGTGLSGGGALSANRTISVNYGTTAGTAAQGNDSRIVNAVPNTRTISAGTGLSGGGSLADNLTLSVNYGTTSGTAAQGNDSRITGAAQKSSNLSDLADAETARSNLGLGTAATHNVGLGSGHLLAQGSVLTLANSSRDATGIAAGNDISWGWNHPSNYSLKLTNNNNCLAILVGRPTNQRITTIQSGHESIQYGAAVGILDLNPVGGVVRVNRHTVRHAGNTTVDGNGFIKNASPIIKLYSDRIEDEGEFHKKPQLERVSKGVYKITGTLGLRINEGWYLETPSDRNGNKYFNIEWEQDVEPENSEGVVDTPVEVVLTVRTYERVWNPQTGIHENGNPVDINELQDRYVSLRFNELRQDEPEIPSEGDENNETL